MKIGCGSVVYREHDIKRTLESIRNIGFEYFETQSTNPWCNHVIIEKDDPVKFADMAKSFGFKGITALWTNEGALISAGEKCTETIKRTIKWAAAANIPVVNFGDGSKPFEMSEEEAFKIYKERLIEILETAEKYKVTMALEPHGTFTLTGDGLIKLMQVSNSEYLGINYDPANIKRKGYMETKNGVASWKSIENSESETEILKRVISRVRHFHIKDLDVNHNCMPLGKGIVDLKGCIEVLKENGYTGAVSLETEGGMGFEETENLCRESYEFMKKHIV